jgi:phospholipid/cholesterol/gamma-HCH transport system substrate-binding protein
MAKELGKTIRVGIVVLVGTLFLIGALYFIGDKQNLFGSKFRLKANFRTVNGLLPGNNVRFGGIDIGTVESVEIVNDSVITVVMMIEEKSNKFIKKNAVARIGTDGLMGNKLVNITATNQPSTMVKEGDYLNAQNVIETDEVLRTLNNTNDDVSIVAKNLRLITNRINEPNSLWNILFDPVVAENVKHAIVKIKLTTDRTAIISGDLKSIISDTKNGKGTIGALLTDDYFSNSIRQTLVNISVLSDSLAYISGDLRSVSQKIKNGEGAIGTILMDTAFVGKINQSMENIRTGTKSFDENMEALKHNFLVRKYFKKQKKLAGKN